MQTRISGAGHVSVVEPMPVRAAAPGGLKIENFVINKTARVATCPAGQVKPITSERTVTKNNA